MTAPLRHEPLSGEAAPLSSEDREALARLAERLQWAQPGGAPPALDSLGALDEAIASGFSIDKDSLPEDERAAMRKLFPGWRNAGAAATAAWLGKALVSAHEGLQWRRGAGDEIFLGGLRQAPNMMIRVARLADAAFEEGSGVSLAGEVAALAAKIEGAAKLAGELDSAESRTDFHINRSGRLAVMDGDELARWTVEQAKLFRQMHHALSDGARLAYDNDGGLVPLGEFAASHRYVQPFSEAARARMAIFLGETARRIWMARRPDAKARWLWSAQRKSLALGVSVAGDDTADEWLYFPMEQLERFFESRQTPQEMAAEVEEFSARLDTATSAETRDEAEADASGEDDGGARQPFLLHEDVSLNEGVLKIRSRLVKRYATDAPDLLLPCLRDPHDGAKALGVLPTSGMFFDTEQELRDQLGTLLERISDHIPGRVEPDFTLFFTFIEASMSDLVTLARPSLEPGGAPRLDFFLWDITEKRPGGALSPSQREREELFDPIGRRIKEALYHLQQTGDATYSRQLIEEALAQDPSRQSALLAMCQLHLAIGNQIMARGYIQAMLQVAPKNIEARLLDSRFLLDEEQFEEAISRARKIAEEDEECAEAWVIMARAKAILGRLDEAREHLDHALALEPSNSEGSMLKATIEGMQRRG